MSPFGEGPGSPSGEGGEFHVEDRRRFKDMGEPRPAEPSPARPAPGEDIPLPGGGVLHGCDPEAEEAQPPVGFGDVVHPFVLMALAGLGVLPHPDRNAPEVNLPAARAAIETLDVLRAKTEGNRTTDETHLIEAALYELKMQYVEACERARTRG